MKTEKWLYAIRQSAQKRRKTTAQAFWEKVDKNGPVHQELGSACWVWTGSRYYEGYGLLTRDGRSYRAHRISLELHGIELPPYTGKADGAVVDHICKNKACVRPDHLRVVSQRENCMELASANPFYRNETATHCPHGHAYTEGNIYWSKKGARSCRLCTILHSKADNTAKRLGMEPRPEWIAARAALAKAQESK